MMKQPALFSLVVLFVLVTLTACGDEAVPPDASAVDLSAVEGVQAARMPSPHAEVPPLKVPAPAPIRPGCGDYRLLVVVESDAVGFGMRVAGPANAVDVVWVLSGPGVAYREPPPEPHTFADDNRDLFGFEANEGHDFVTARFSLLVSGVQPGQQLQLELGQEAPGAQGSRVTIYNATQDLGSPGQELLSLEVTDAYQRVNLNLCAAQAMPLPPTQPALQPRLLAFYYPWWGTSPEACGGDIFAWLREVDGRAVIVTGHMLIFQDGDAIIYRHTDCWEQVTDDTGRRGWIYSVRDPAFFAEQMALARAYGLDGFALSVHGDNPGEMAFLQRAVAIAEKVGFSIAPLYEAPEAGWTYDEQADAEQVGSHLREIVRMMAGQPAALTVTQDGLARVAVFVDPAVMARFPTPDSWAVIRAMVDEAQTPYFLWSGPGAFGWAFRSGVDGVYNDLEVVETLEAPLGLSPYALRDERRLAYRATAWAARERGMPLALPVVPGWEGAQVIASPEDISLSRDYGAPGQYGAYYRTRWEDALEQAPDWIVMTSWNEWAEGTEIEPSDVYPPSRFDYLQATWTYACRWRGGPECP